MPRILVVDDEANIRKLYEHELRDAGYTVDTATNAAEALQAVVDRRPDLVILDIKLEHDNGLDCLRQMKQHDPTLSVLLNSGYSTYKDDFSSWLADAYIVKSADTRELLDTVQELVEGRPVG